MLSLILGFAAAVSAENLHIYDDQLRNGFEDWGWAPHSLTNASPVHSGSHSISVSAGPWAGLYLHHPEMDTHRYTNVTFWAHGGERGGQLLRIGTKLGTNDEPGYVLPTGLSANRWEQFSIPLGLFGAANRTNFAGIMIQLRDDCPTNSFYLDEIELEAAVSSASLPILAPDSAPPQPQALPPPDRREPVPGPGLITWIASGVALALVLLVWLVVTVRRGARQNSTALVPRPGPPRPSSADLSEDTCEVVSAEDWRHRAMAAEAVANKQAQLLRENLLPELAEIAKSSLVQGLSSQRDALMETQRRAHQELADLESRLAALHLPLRERILIYEKRITELEKDLANRGEEMRELIRATLSLVRARLEEEKTKVVLGNGAH